MGASPSCSTEVQNGSDEVSSITADDGKSRKCKNGRLACGVAIGVRDEDRADGGGRPSGRATGDDRSRSTTRLLTGDDLDEQRVVVFGARARVGRSGHRGTRSASPGTPRRSRRPSRIGPMTTACTVTIVSSRRWATSANSRSARSTCAVASAAARDASRPIAFRCSNIGLSSARPARSSRSRRRASRPAATSTPTCTIAVISVATAMMPRNSSARSRSRGLPRPRLLIGLAPALDARWSASRVPG